MLANANIPVIDALCFVGAEWSLFAKPFQQQGVWVTWARKLAAMIAEPGPLSSERVPVIARQLADALPAKIRASG